jgi:hypothetical protein
VTLPNPTQVERVPTSTRPPLRSGFFRLARVVQGLLGLTVLMHLVLVVADWYYLGLADRLIATPRKVPFEDLERYDTVVMLTNLPYLGLLILTGSAFISWLYKAHRSDRLDPVALSHKSFWAIIGWFVPIMSLFRPTQMISDTRRGADPLAVSPAYQPIWWGAFILGAFGDRIVGGLWPTGEEPGLRTFGEKLEVAAWAELGFSLVNIIAAVLAILVVREITALLRDAPLGLRVD